MVSTGTIIAANDYNTIQSLANQVLGVNTGGGLYGYGQTVASGQVSQYSQITVTQWRNLREDILRCRQHQTGTDLSAQLTYPTQDVKVTATDREAYLTMMQTAATDANRLATPPSTQAARESLTTTTRTAAWNGTISHSITISFPGYNLTSGSVPALDHIRCFFNTGGRFELSSSLTGGTSGSVGTKDYSWSVLLSSMGTIYFNRTNTTTTGTGTTYAVGYETLTGTDQLIFQKDTIAGYSPNRFQIYARKPSTTSIVFTLYWADLSGNPNPGWGTDENVTGSLTSYAQVYRASGTNVSVPKPDASATAL